MTEFPQGCIDREEIKSKQIFSMQLFSVPHQFQIIAQAVGPTPRYCKNLILVFNT